MAGNTYAAPSASRDATINSKVSAGSTTAGMHKTSTGTGYGKGQNTGGTNGSGHRCKTFSSGGVINGKV